MGKKEHRRRRRSSTAIPPERSRAGETSMSKPTGATSIHDLPDDLLELVLLRIRSSVFLVRAAAACKLWRRVLAGAAASLRRLDPPPHVLGHYYDYHGRTAVFVPSPAPPGEAPVNVRGRVSLSFLAAGRNYYRPEELKLGDSRGSLLSFVHPWSSVVIVCDPLNREHRELDTRSAWHDTRRNFLRSSCSTLGAFLLASSLDMSSFKVLCVCLVRDCDNGTKTARAAVFSATARDGRWLLLGSADVGGIMLRRSSWFDARTKFLGRAGGSLCWSGEVSNAVLHLDESSGVFSTFTLPAGNHLSMSYHRGNLRVVGGVPGGSVQLARVLGDSIEVLRWTRDDGAGEECVVETKVCLSQLVGIEVKLDWSWRFLDTAETVTPGHVVLLPNEEYMWMFCVDVETMETKRLHKRNWHGHRVFPYELPWPPTIKVCV
ncbi:unnamed protein product [Urochloa humidicola]